MILAAIVAIITDLQEEGALVAPHVIEHVGNKVAGDGHQSDEMALTRRLAAFDALIHGLIARHTVAEMLSYVDGGVAAVGRALFGDPLGAVEGRAGNMLTGGQAQEAGHVFATGEARDVTDLGDQSQGVADAGSLDRSEQLGLLAVLDQGVAGLEEEGLALLEGGNVLGVGLHQVADRIPSDGPDGGLAGRCEQLLGLGQAESGLAVGGQDGGQGFIARLDELIGEQVLLKQGVDSGMMQFAAGKGLTQRRTIGPQQSTQLVLWLLLGTLKMA